MGIPDPSAQKYPMLLLISMEIFFFLERGMLNCQWDTGGMGVRVCGVGYQGAVN